MYLGLKKLGSNLLSTFFTRLQIMFCGPHLVLLNIFGGREKLLNKIQGRVQNPAKHLIRSVLRFS